MASIEYIISDKLNEINFYSIDIKKDVQQKKLVEFNNSEIEDIKNKFRNFIKKYPKDIAFIKSVVVVKGMDKKTNEPFVRLGSYDKSSDINLPFSDEEQSSDFLSGGINYFTIINNSGPDLRDFSIVPGDKVEINSSLENETKDKVLNKHANKLDNEPLRFSDEELSEKEESGLNKLISTNKLNNNLNKIQKDIISKLLSKGYLFREPLDSSDYKKKILNHPEFSKKISVWKKK